MREEYDFTGAKRAKDIPHLAQLQAEATQGKTQLILLIDDDLLAAIRDRAGREGKGYQALINDVLRVALAAEAS